MYAQVYMHAPLARDARGDSASREAAMADAPCCFVCSERALSLSLGAGIAPSCAVPLTNGTLRNTHAPLSKQMLPFTGTPLLSE